MFDLKENHVATPNRVASGKLASWPLSNKNDKVLLVLSVLWPNNS